MAVMRVFDRLFVNQLFDTSEGGRTIFAPFGLTGTTYLVPPEREAGLRSGVRWIAVISLGGTFALIGLLRLIESWLGVTVPLPWFIAGAVAVVALIFVAMMRALSRLTAGLVPVSDRT